LQKNEPLRLGVLIDSFQQPAWVLKIIRDITSSSVAKIDLIIKHEKNNKKPIRLLRNIIRNRRYLLFFAYSKLDKCLFRVKPDAFEVSSLKDLLADCPIISVYSMKKGNGYYFRQESVTTLQKQELDVVLYFGGCFLKGAVLNIAKYGIWSYYHGDNRTILGGPSGFWEVMEAYPLSGSILQILTEDFARGKVIYRSYSATYKYSVNKNKNRYYWKSSAFVMRKLKELYTEGPSALNSEQRNSEYCPYIYPLYTKPSNFAMFWLLLRVCKRLISRAKEKTVYRDQWFLAYNYSSSEDAELSFYQFTNLKPPSNRIWADPFPVKTGNIYFIFIEELFFNTNKGVISVIEMDQNGKYKKPVKILEKSYHLSHPFIFEWEGIYYMIPETSGNRTIELYRCIDFPFKWEPEKIIMENIRAVDTTLAKIGDLWWMFVNIGVDGSDNNDELYLFYTKEPLGEWEPHKRNPVKSDVRSSRPAGRLFRWKGSLYRPSQNCSKDGYSISVNKVIRIDPEEFEEKQAAEISPLWDKDIIRTHTINSVEGLTLIDCQMKRIRML